MQDRWGQQKIIDIKATPRRPNPKEPEDSEAKAEREPQPKQVRFEDVVEEPVTRPPREARSRNFRITKRLLEKYGCSPSCEGCEAMLDGKRPREHNSECRERIEKSMELGPEDSEKIRRHDERVCGGPPESQPQAERKAKAAGEEQHDQPAADGDRCDGQPGEPGAKESDVLYGNVKDQAMEDNEHEGRDEAARSSREDSTQRPGGAKREGEPQLTREELAERMKMRRIEQAQAQAGKLSDILNLGKYDGSRQALRG